MSDLFHSIDTTTYIPNIFSKNKSTRRHTVKNVDKIDMIDISEICHNFMPCSHDVFITYENGETLHKNMTKYAIHFLLKDCGINDLGHYSLTELDKKELDTGCCCTFKK